MATAETTPKKARKTLGDLLLQSAKEQLHASDTAARMRRLEDVSSPAPPNPLPASTTSPLPAAPPRQAPDVPDAAPQAAPGTGPGTQSAPENTTPDVRSDVRSGDRSDVRSDARTLGLATGLTFGLTLGQSDVRSDDRSGVRSDDRSGIRSDVGTGHKSGVRPLRQPSLADSLTPRQHAVLSFLLEHRPRIINCVTIAAHVGGSEDSIRSILSRLKKVGFLGYSKAKIGAIQGLTFHYNEPLCALLEAPCVPLPQAPPPDVPPDDRSDDRSGVRSDDRSGVRSDVGTGAKTGVEAEMHHTDLRKIDREDLSISRARARDPREVLLALTDEDITFFWPNLARVDFRKAQIVQIVEKLETLGTPVDDVRKSLDHADYELGAGPLNDARGNPVADPRSYIFHAIAKTGYYRRPPGYVSAQEQAELDAAEEARRVAKARAEREDAEFHAWRTGLDPETVQTLLEGRRGPEEVWLRAKWREKRRAGEA